MSKKISELTDAAALDGTEQLEAVQSGANVKVTVNNLLPVQLQGDRTIDLNGKKLTIIEGAYPLPSLLLDPTEDAEVSSLFAVNDTDGGNYGGVRAEMTNLTADSTWGVLFNNGAKFANIVAHADGSIATMEYNGDTHTFNHAIITPDIIALDFANDGAAASGGVAIGQWYHTSGTLKIRLA